MALTVRRRRGFTLIEVLAATALFALLGTLLFQMMQGAMDVWSRGERVRASEESASAALDLLAEDLRHLWTGVAGEPVTEARLFCEPVPVDIDGDGTGDGLATRLRFSRVLHEARSLPWLRRAGETPAAEGYATLTGDEDPVGLLPTGGLAETLYVVVQPAGEPLPVLLRCVRTPLGGVGSLLDPDVLLTDAQLMGAGVAVVGRVLHFGVDAWTPATTAWESDAGHGDVPATPFWDSTRGVIPTGDPRWPYAVGDTSLEDGRDDVFPAMLRLTLALDPYDDRRAAPGVLAEPLGAEGKTLRLRAALGGDDRAPSHVWIDGEWMVVTDVDGRSVSVARGDLPRAHDAGAAVRVGRVFTRYVRIPTARERPLR